MTTTDDVLADLTLPDEAVSGFTVFAEPRPSSPLRADDRRHRCYELTFEWMALHLLELPAYARQKLSPQLHHGSIERPPLPRIGHAWVTFRQKDGTRWVQEPVLPATMPEDVWKEWADARTYRRYDCHGATKLGLAATTYGPWHPRPFGTDDCGHGLDDCPHGCEEG